MPFDCSICHFYFSKFFQPILCFFCFSKLYQSSITISDCNFSSYEHYMLVTWHLNFECILYKFLWNSKWKNVDIVYSDWELWSIFFWLLYKFIKLAMCFINIFIPSPIMRFNWRSRFIWTVLEVTLQKNRLSG